MSVPARRARYAATDSPPSRPATHSPRLADSSSRTHASPTDQTRSIRVRPFRARATSTSPVASSHVGSSHADQPTPVSPCHVDPRRHASSALDNLAPPRVHATPPRLAAPGPCSRQAIPARLATYRPRLASPPRLAEPSQSEQAVA